MPSDDFSRMGRGRRNDSGSSSRGSSSSPRPSGRKRSFSPPSDDDSVLPPIECDDTPPPPDRPLIRQALGFQEAPKSDGIVTYQATPSKPQATPFFLPGQEVASQAKDKAKRARKTKRTDQFWAQTGRFRIPVYDPTPSSQPPLGHGSGPYNAQFRGTTPNIPTQRPGGSSRPPKNLNASPSHRNSHLQKPSGSKGKATVSNTNGSTSQQQTTTYSSLSARASTTNVVSQTPEINFAEKYTDPPPLPQENRNTRSSSPTSTSYYRRDYEKDREGSLSLEGSRGGHEHSGGSMLSGRSLNHLGNGGSSAQDSSKRPPKIPLRMVTLLINDIRSGEDDHQLAEVRVGLRLAEDPSYGYWADAKELSEALQAGPSRIDGPAKIYTMRGRYRQFFLRVSADNENEFSSVNLNVKTDRTLEVVVEALGPPQPGRPLRAPGLRSRTPDLESDRDFHDGNSEMSNIRRTPPNHRNAINQSRKHRLSPFDDYDYSSTPDVVKKRRATSSSTARSMTHDISAHVSPSVSSPRYLTRSPPRPMDIDDSVIGDGDDSDNDSPPASLYYLERGYETPTSDDEPEKVHKSISMSIDHLINADPAWAKFFSAKASERVASYLEQYKFVKKLLDRHVGQLAPFKSSSKYIIKESHILEALHIEGGDKYISDCKETLRLVKLYGKGGSCYEDAKVVEMMEDKSHPTAYSSPIKRFLRLLREIDEKWEGEHTTAVNREADDNYSD